MSTPDTEPTEIEWSFVDNPPDQSSSDDDWYALRHGYINLAAILADPAQVEAVERAAALLDSFFDAIRDAGIREPM